MDETVSSHLCRHLRTHLRIERHGIWHVHLCDVSDKTTQLTYYICVAWNILPLSVHVLDEGVGHPVPGGGPASGRPEHWVMAEVGGRVQHWHAGPVALNVVTLVWSDQLSNWKLKSKWLTSQKLSTMWSLRSGKATRVVLTSSMRPSMPWMYSPIAVMLSQSSAMYFLKYFSTTSKS